MSRYDNTELLAGIRAKARIPDESVNYDADRIFLEADEVLLNRITQEILGTFQEHYVTFFDHVIVANEQAVNIPGCNVGSVVRNITYFTNSTDSVGSPVPRFDLSEIDTLFGTDTGAIVQGHAFRDDQFLILPKPSSTQGTLRVHIEYRPGKLVPTAEAMQITGINTSTGQLDGNAPAAWTTGNNFALVRVNSPHAQVGFNLTASAVVSATSVTFTPADLDFNRIAIGDYVSLDGESPIAQCHAAFYTALQWGTASSILQQLGDHANGAMAQQRFENALEEARHLISPRNKGAPEYIINRSGHMRNGRGYRSRGLL